MGGQEGIQSLAAEVGPGHSVGLMERRLSMVEVQREQPAQVSKTGTEAEWNSKPRPDLQDRYPPVIAAYFELFVEV